MARDRSRGWTLVGLRAGETFKFRFSSRGHTDINSDVSKAYVPPEPISPQLNSGGSERFPAVRPSLFFVYCRMRFLTWVGRSEKEKKTTKKLKRNLELGGLVPQHNIHGAWKQQGAAQMEQLSEITDALQFSCGALFIPEDHELSGVFVVR